MILPLAMLQITSKSSIQDNVRLIEPLIRQAATDGAHLISLPEVANLMQMNRKLSVKQACLEAEDPLLILCQRMARELDIWIHIGSLVIKLPDREATGSQQLANRAFMINNMGQITARYDKIHMFDVDLEGGESYRESALFRPGKQAVITETPWGKIGLTICYDVRFPHLHRNLADAGAVVILNPAAFTKKTGMAHWHTLLTARAIENTCFVVAAAQTGTHEDDRQTYGHSLAISPWGDILADGGVDESIIHVRLDLDKVNEIRAMVPSLKNNREFDPAL